MLILTCPYCNVAADETELTPGGEAHLTRAGADATEAQLESYLFHRQNPRGVHFERWRHSYGCGKWFHAARCTVTLEVFGTYSAQTTAPPKAIEQAIRARRPDWTPAPAIPAEGAETATASAADPATSGRIKAKTGAGSPKAPRSGAKAKPASRSKAKAGRKPSESDSKTGVDPKTDADTAPDTATDTKGSAS